MLLSEGDKVLVAHRRLFPEDLPRFFTGTVMVYVDGVMKVSGHTWIREPMHGIVIRKPDKRTKIFSVMSGTLFVYELPYSCSVDSLEMEHDDDGELWLVDGKGLRMNLSERERPIKAATQR